ncbi:hypothetical protein ACF1GX_30250 [Streptomyces albidoflavus]
MTPRPDAQTRETAKARVAGLKQTRDQAHETADQAKVAADEAMWQAIAAELDAGTVLQRDVAETTGFSRDHILRRTKPYRQN